MLILKLNVTLPRRDETLAKSSLNAESVSLPSLHLSLIFYEETEIAEVFISFSCTVADTISHAFTRSTSCANSRLGGLFLHFSPRSKECSMYRATGKNNSGPVSQAVLNCRL